MKKTTENQTFRIFILLCLSAIALSICAMIVTEPDAIGESQLSAVELESNWYQVKDIDDVTLISLPCTLEANEDGVLRVSAMLDPSDGQDSFIVFETTRCSVKVTVNRRVVYEYGDENNIFAGKSPASRHHIVNVGRSFSKNKVEIEFTTKTPTVPIKVNKIYEGTETECVMMLLMGDLGNAFSSAILGIVGIIIVIGYVVFKKYLTKGNELLYIGLLAILTAIWSFTETTYMDFIFDNPNVAAIIRYTSLTLVPMPMLFYVRANREGKMASIIKFIEVCNIIVYIVSVGLYVAKVVDYHSVIVFTHLLLVVTISITTYNNIREFALEKDITRKIFIALASFLMGFAILVDLYRYYHMTSSDNASFVRIALLLYICIYAFRTLTNLLDMAKLGSEAEALEHIAYTDLLTGVKNRAAFDRDLRDLPASKYGDIRIIGFDVNNLKFVNDTYGHMAGDKMIISAARVITEAFKNEGTCYRIGGDEFEVIMLDSTQRVYDACCEKLQKIIQLVNSKTEYPVTMAYGDAVFDVDSDRELDMMIKRADEKMYEMKKRMKMKEKG